MNFYYKVSGVSFSQFKFPLKNNFAYQIQVTKQTLIYHYYLYADFSWLLQFTASLNMTIPLVYKILAIHARHPDVDSFSFPVANPFRLYQIHPNQPGRSFRQTFTVSINGRCKPEQTIMVVDDFDSDSVIKVVFYTMENSFH